MADVSDLKTTITNIDPEEQTLRIPVHSTTIILPYGESYSFFGGPDNLHGPRARLSRRSAVRNLVDAGKLRIDRVPAIVNNELVATLDDGAATTRYPSWSGLNNLSTLQTALKYFYEFEETAGDLLLDNKHPSRNAQLTVHVPSRYQLGVAGIVGKCLLAKGSPPVSLTDPVLRGEGPDGGLGLSCRTGVTIGGWVKIESATNKTALILGALFPVDLSEFGGEGAGNPFVDGRTVLQIISTDEEAPYSTLEISTIVSTVNLENALIDSQISLAPVLDPQPAIGEWFHVAAAVWQTADDDLLTAHLKMWINGATVASEDTEFFEDTTPDDRQLMGATGVDGIVGPTAINLAEIPTTLSNVKVDQLFFANRALTDEEIETLYNNGAGIAWGEIE